MKTTRRQGLLTLALPFLPAGYFLFAGPPVGEEDADRAKADRVINIVAERFSFIPSQIKLTQGEVVELRLRSLDTNHGFRLRDVDVNVVIPKRGKGDARVLFRAQRKGVFEFECSKPCGAGHTIMRGRIVVE